MESVSVIQVAPDLYFMFGTHKSIQRKKRKNKKPDADTMDGNTLLWVTQKACVSQGQLLLQRTTGTVTSVKNMSHQRDFGKICMIRVE